MKKVKFYICLSCNNIVCSTSDAETSCCGRKLHALSPKMADLEHEVTLTEVEYDLYLTINHEMIKSHYISFVACVSYDRVTLIKLYPEQNAQVRLPNIGKQKIYIYCTQHSFMELP